MPAPIPEMVPLHGSQTVVSPRIVVLLTMAHPNRRNQNSGRFIEAIGIQQHHSPNIVRHVDTIDSHEHDPEGMRHNRGRTSLKNTPICSTTRS